MAHCRVLLCNINKKSSCCNGGFLFISNKHLVTFHFPLAIYRQKTFFKYYGHIDILHVRSLYIIHILPTFLQHISVFPVKFLHICLCSFRLALQPGPVHRYPDLFHCHLPWLYVPQNKYYCMSDHKPGLTSSNRFLHYTSMKSFSNGRPYYVQIH